MTSKSVSTNAVEMSISPSAPSMAAGKEAKLEPIVTGRDDSVVPAPDPETLLEAAAKEMPLGITRIPEGTDLWAALDGLGLLYSKDHGTSCCGRVIDADHIGVSERQGAVKFHKPGQYVLWDVLTNWARPPELRIADPVLQAGNITIVSLNQRETAVARDQSQKTILLKQGRYILVGPAGLCTDEKAIGADGRERRNPYIVSLVDLPRQMQVDRFNFFNVPQGEVAGITLPNGQVQILQPGVHIVENAKIERFLPTVPIQSKLRKDVITSDQVSVALEVDITTQLVDCARFLKMSAGVSHGGQGGCKDLYDAIEESAQSVFIDMFSKYKYYEGRTRQGEEESKFEDHALQALDREAFKYGGRVFKVNILKYRADAVEAAYAQHNKQQIELEHKKLSQQRNFDIQEADQKHQQQMTERDEKAATTKQTLAQERDMAAKQHTIKLQMEDAKARELKVDLESKAEGDRQKLQAQHTTETAKVRSQGEADAQAGKIRAIAEAEAYAEDLKNKARVHAVDSLAKALSSNKELLELERQKMVEELQIQKLQMAAKAGGRIVPVELLRMNDLADERALRRVENTPMMQVFSQANMPGLLEDESVNAAATAVATNNLAYANGGNGSDRDDRKRGKGRM